MTAKLRAAVAGTGMYVPERVLSNADLERMVDTSNEWIVERTGIRERRLAAPDETTSTLAIEAARQACQQASLDPADLDLILVSTVTPDYPFPATACLVQHALGAKRAAAVDLSGACSGFLYGTAMATAQIESGRAANVLAIGAETLSRVVDYTDRGTCILFGDGAGAVLFRGTTQGPGVRFYKLGADGSQSEMLRLPGGGSKHPASADSVAQRLHYMQIEGRKVFKFATTVFVELVEQALTASQLTRDDVALIIPHQVNERIIDAAMKRLEFPVEKFFINIDRYGNTSAASVPIALHEAIESGRLKRGDTAILLAFGAGLAWGVAVVQF